MRKGEICSEKKGPEKLASLVLRCAEVCPCHQQLGHPHKTFSASSAASRSSGRSSWPTKRPSVPQRCGGTAGGFDEVLGPPSVRYEDATWVSSPIHQWFTYIYSL